MSSAQAVPRDGGEEGHPRKYTDASVTLAIDQDLLLPHGTCEERTLHQHGGIPFYVIDNTKAWVWDAEQAGDFVRLEHPRYHVVCEFHDIPKAVFEAVLPFIYEKFTLPKDRFSARDVFSLASRNDYRGKYLYMSRGDLRTLALVVDQAYARGYLVTTTEVPYITVDKSSWPVSCVVNKAYMFFDADGVYPEMCWQQKGLRLYDKKKNRFCRVERGSQSLYRVHELFGDLACNRLSKRAV